MNPDQLYEFINLDQFPEVKQISYICALHIPWNNKKVVIAQLPETSVIYLIIEQVSKNKYNILSLLLDPKCIFQQGDCFTTAYLKESVLTIFNSGDVSSKVVIEDISKDFPVYKTIVTPLDVVLDLLYTYNNFENTDTFYKKYKGVDRISIHREINELITIINTKKKTC